MIHVLLISNNNARNRFFFHLASLLVKKSNGVEIVDLNGRASINLSSQGTNSFIATL